MPSRTRRRRSARRRRSRAGTGALATWILGAVIVLIVGAYLAIRMSTPAQADLDQATLCPTDPSLIPQVHAILLERNRRVFAGTGDFAPMDPNTAHEIRRLLTEELVALPLYTKVVLHEVSYDRKTLYDPVATLCRPDDGSNDNEITGNPAMAKRRFEERFLDPLTEIIGERSGWSPDHRFSLWQSFDGLARLAFADPALAHAGRSLSVVSDFVVPQNFGLSSWRSLRPGAAVREEPPAPNWRTPSFGGAEVTMLYVRMRYEGIPDIQGNEHLGWWERYFTDRDAIIREVHHVGADW